MHFSVREMIAIFKMANAMVMADGKIEDEEIRLMSIEATKFGIQLNEFKRLVMAAESMDVSESIEIVSNMSLEQKEYVASYLGVIMISDGDIDDKELALWKMLTFMCKLPPMSLPQAIDNWNNL